MLKSAKWLIVYEIQTVAYFYTSLRASIANMLYLSYLFFGMACLCFFMTLFDFHWLVKDITSLQQRDEEKK